MFIQLTFNSWLLSFIQYIIVININLNKQTNNMFLILNTVNDELKLPQNL